MAINKRSWTEQDSKKILTMIVLIVVLMVCTTSATYAYFALSATNNAATGTAATANMTLSVTRATMKSTNTGVMVPQSESALASAMNSTNQCVDANGNIICEVYTITITNTSTAAVKVKGTIQFSGNGSMPNLKWRRTTNTTTLGSNTSVAVGTNTTTLWDIPAGTACSVDSGTGLDTGCTKISLAKTNGSQTYYIVIWINETGSSQTDTGTWTATIKFEGENGTGITSTITSTT